MNRKRLRRLRGWNKRLLQKSKFYMKSPALVAQLDRAVAF